VERTSRPVELSRRYVAWLRRNALAIILAHLALVGVAVYLIINYLPLRADFSYLLPQDAPAVRDLRRLESRIKASDTVLVVVEAPSPEVRERAMRALVAGMQNIPRALVETVESDDTEVREFFKARRHLFVPLPELERARDVLDRKIKQAKLAANPLYIDVDEPDPAQVAKDQRELEDLRVKRREAEARLAKSSNVSADGRIAIIQVRTPFRATDAGKGAQLITALDKIRTTVVAANPGLQVGFTGGVVTAVAEHGAIAKGVIISGLITTVLIGLVLSLYFRSATMLIILVGSLGVATVISIGIAAITVGQLNAATAFLGAIIAGNGINYGILLIARYLEERRKHDVDTALAAAIVGTLRPTAVASLGAAIAYGSLAATSFKGFADFAIIGSIGMIVCWIVSYGLLPAVMLRFGRDTRMYQGDPFVGSMLVRVLGFRSSKHVVIVAAVAAVIAGGIVVRYVAADPFEYDIKQLRSEGDDAVTARRWMGVSDQNFGRGISGRTYIAADQLEQVPRIVKALREHDAKLPFEQQTFGSINSILDVVPDDQAKKLVVLGEIRALLDDDALEALDEAERKEIFELRPPDALAAITPETLPKSIRARLEEKDGRIGYLISIRPANHLDEWDGRDLIRFAHAVRRIEIGNDEAVTTSGSSVIFADIVESIERDGPVVTGVAALGLVIMVVVVVGRNRRSLAVLVGTFSGSLLMVAVCALIGLRVNFLDFVALPITLGLGVDYAINVAHRHDSEEKPDPIATLRTSGSAVFVCSLTTIIGYGSLLVSHNLAIRGFGLASLIGEIACVFTALVLVPAILAVGRKDQDSRFPSARQR
jgi:predicted RND superfamily exporter protein